LATARRLLVLRHQIADKLRDVDEASTHVPTLSAAIAAAEETHRAS
jgi:hypothetical protein